MARFILYQSPEDRKRASVDLLDLVEKHKDEVQLIDNSAGLRILVEAEESAIEGIVAQYQSQGIKFGNEVTLRLPNPRPTLRS